MIDYILKSIHADRKEQLNQTGQFILKYFFKFILFIVSDPSLTPFFFRSSRGKDMLLIGDIKYRVNRICSDKVRWRCATHERFGCPARLHTVDNEVVYFVNEHKLS